MIGKWIDDNTVEHVIISSYCEGKGRLWQILFGWRSDHKGQSRFIMSKRDWQKVKVEIEYYNKFVKDKAND